MMVSLDTSFKGLKTIICEYYNMDVFIGHYSQNLQYGRGLKHGKNQWMLSEENMVALSCKHPWDSVHE